MSAEEDNDRPSIKTLLQVLGRKLADQKKYLLFTNKILTFTGLHIFSSRLLGIRWSRIWLKWLRFAPKPSISNRDSRPARRRLSRRCLVLQRSSTIIPWHCKSL